MTALADCGHQGVDGLTPLLVPCGACYTALIEQAQKAERCRCAYCSFGDDAPQTAELLHRHIQTCEFHPMAKLVARVQTLEAAATAYRDLATCYRMRRRPTDKLFARLDLAAAALDNPPPQP